MTDSSDTIENVRSQAYDAMESGALDESSRLFAYLLEHHPHDHVYHYMRGLARKYLLDWAGSLQHNLHAIEYSKEFDEAAHWNAGIAATGLGNWKQARRMWAACGIQISGNDGPIAEDFGIAAIRLSPWDRGETVFARRIDPVRARILNVPLPESGHRFGDIVLHDGAATGSRYDGAQEVHVFNELQRLLASEFQTFVVFVTASAMDDLDALLRAKAPGIGYVEDWTGSLRNLCLRCSYGTPHLHGEDRPGEWQPERNLGIAAQSRHSVQRLLEEWARADAGRRVDGIETREIAASSPGGGGHVWWREPEQ